MALAAIRCHGPLLALAMFFAGCGQADRTPNDGGLGGNAGQDGSAGTSGSGGSSGGGPACGDTGQTCCANQTCNSGLTCTGIVPNTESFRCVVCGSKNGPCCVTGPQCGPGLFCRPTIDTGWHC